MSGLTLKLAPKERILINGAVIENGDRRSKICIKTPNVNVLRLKDAMHPLHAATPVSRACFLAQMILSGDIGISEGRQQLLGAIEALAQVFDDPGSRASLSDAGQQIIAGNTYMAMRRLRDLLPREEQLMRALKQ